MIFFSFPHNHIWPPTSRAVASLTVPGGQGSTFLIFSSNFDQFSLFFLRFYLFSSSFWLSGWASRPPGKSVATPLPTSIGRLATVTLWCLPLGPPVLGHSERLKKGLILWGCYGSSELPVHPCQQVNQSSSAH